VADPIRYFFDQHVQHAIAEGLRLRGADVLTAQDAGRCGRADSDQLQFATAEGRVLVTYETDFLVLAATGLQHAGIAWSDATKYSIGQMIQVLTLLHGVLDLDEMKNHVEYL
jgi:predicted nuclease of predicted toxin-antitoxin system